MQRLFSITCRRGLSASVWRGTSAVHTFSLRTLPCLTTAVRHASSSGPTDASSAAGGNSSGVAAAASPSGAGGFDFGGDVESGEETHPDFQPRFVSSDLAEDEVAMIKKDIDDTIKQEDLVAFIKGVPEAPMCAFSKRMIDVLEALGVEYTSFDVLAHPVVRSYVKEVSEWPTIPQLFVKGEFAGGVDIVLKMAESGDLQVMLDQKGIKHRFQEKQ